MLASIDIWPVCKFDLISAILINQCPCLPLASLERLLIAVAFQFHLFAFSVSFRLIVLPYVFYGFC